MGILLGFLFGPRALNAVVAPAIVAIAAAVWQVKRTERPTLHRSVPSEGTAGETVSVNIVTEGSVNRLGHVADTVPGELHATGHDRPVDLDDGLEYELELTQRGRHYFGQIEVTVTDILGLAERTFEYRQFDEILVYPRRHAINVDGLERIANLAGFRLQRERHEFDRLREYRPEDSLRDIHWKSSAKRPDIDFVVKEFVSETERGTVSISGGATPQGVDTLASVMASLATALVANGVKVGIDSPDGTIEPIDTPRDLRGIFVHLATMGPGEAEARSTLHVSAATDSLDEAVIHINDEQVSFTTLLEDNEGKGAYEAQKPRKTDPIPSGVSG